MIVDFHVHLWEEGYLPERWHRATAERWAHSQFPPRDPDTVFPRIMPGMADPDASWLISLMDRTGIDASVAMMLDWAYAMDQEPAIPLEAMMEHYNDLQKRYPGRIYAFAGVDPRRPGAEKILRRAFSEFGLKGLKLYPPAGFYAYDEACLPLYRICSEFNVPVLFHTAVIGYPMRSRFANPLNIMDVQRAFPDLTIVLGHAGHRLWWEEAADVAAAHPRTYLEISNWNADAARRPVEFLSTLARWRDMVGAHRILFASDNLGGRRFAGEESAVPAWLDFMKSLPKKGSEHGHKFTDEEVSLMLGANAQRILGL